MSKGRISPRRWAAAWACPPAGRAADFVERFRVRPGERFVLLLRVSSRQQGRRRNLDAQRENLTRAVEEKGGKVVAVIQHEWSGTGPEWERKLAHAGRVTRQHDAVLLSVTLDRMLRPHAYRSDNALSCQAQPTTAELQTLAAATDCRMMTFAHPDATPGKCRSLLTRWGQQYKSRPGGRPRKPDTLPGHCKRVADKWRPIVLKLAARWRGSKFRLFKRLCRRAGEQVVSYPTVCKWLREKLPAKA